MQYPVEINLHNKFAGRPQPQSPQQQAINRTRQIVERLQRGGPSAAGALNAVAWGYHQLTHAFMQRDPHAFEAAKLELAQAFKFWFERT
jgi:hypothetical protein